MNIFIYKKVGAVSSSIWRFAFELFGEQVLAQSSFIFKVPAEHWISARYNLHFVILV